MQFGTLKIFAVLVLLSGGVYAESPHDPSPATPSASNRPVADDVENLKKTLERFLSDPDKFINREGDAFLKRLKREKPDVAEQVEKILADYERLFDYYKKFYAENIQGRRPGDVAADTWTELKKRSRELRSLETSLNDLLGNDDIRSLLEDFRRDPEAFLRVRADKLIQRLKEVHSDKLAEIDRLINDYKRQQDQLRKLIDEKINGRSADQIASDTLDELRTRSADVRRIEGRVNEIITDVVTQLDAAQKTVKSLPDRLKPFQAELDRLRNDERKKAERDAKEWLDKRKKEVDHDLRKILGGSR